MTDAQLIAGMRSRVMQLHRIAELAHSKEISDLVVKVAGEIQAEIKRLEAPEAKEPGFEMPMSPQIS